MTTTKQKVKTGTFSFCDFTKTKEFLRWPVVNYRDLAEWVSNWATLKSKEDCIYVCYNMWPCDLDTNTPSKFTLTEIADDIAIDEVGCFTNVSIDNVNFHIIEFSNYADALNYCDELMKGDPRYKK